MRINDIVNESEQLNEDWQSIASNIMNNTDPDLLNAMMIALGASSLKALFSTVMGVRKAMKWLKSNTTDRAEQWAAGGEE